MRLYARERCADPRAYYDTVEEVMGDGHLSADEKEYILKSMAVDAELLRANETDDKAHGEQPTELAAIHKALNQLGDAHSFEDRTVKTMSTSAVESRVFSRIVAAIVGNDVLDGQVIRKTDAIARLSGGEAIFVSVLPPEPVPSAIGTSSFMRSAIVVPPDEVRAALRARVQERKRRAWEAISQRVGSSSRYSLEVRTGLIADEVLHSAEKHSADLVVIGSHERSWIGGLFSSDTAQQVSSHSTCPVLIVPENVEGRR